MTSKDACRSELLRGPLYYVLVLMAATTTYWRESPVGVVAMSLMCGGDGLADVVGRRLGRGNALPWNPAKSWAGSGAMFLGKPSSQNGMLAGGDHSILSSCVCQSHHDLSNCLRSPAGGEDQLLWPSREIPEHIHQAAGASDMHTL